MFLVAGLIVSFGGCQSFTDTIHYNDVVDDFVIGWRNKVWASQAWHREKPNFHDHEHLDAFGEGFRAGYKDVASGGNGCPPPLPPNKYWNWRYQSFEGQAKVAAWFEGFPYGAAAAEHDNAAAGREIQVSEPIKIQYSHEFQNIPVPAEYLPPDRHDPRAGRGGNTPFEELPLGPPNNYQGSLHRPVNPVRPLRPGPIEQGYRGDPARYRGTAPGISPPVSGQYQQVSYAERPSNPRTVSHAVGVSSPSKAGPALRFVRLPRVEDPASHQAAYRNVNFAQSPARLTQFGAAE